MLPRKFYLDSIFDKLISESEVSNIKCDIYEADGRYYIEAEIPGIDKKDINIECNDGYITITATKEEITDDQEKNYIKKERFYGKYERQFYVGDVMEDDIKAEFNNGMLKITIPKKEEKKTSKLINID